MTNDLTQCVITFALATLQPPPDAMQALLSEHSGSHLEEASHAALHAAPHAPYAPKPPGAAGTPPSSSTQIALQVIGFMPIGKEWGI